MNIKGLTRLDQPLMYQLSECHTGTQTNLSVTIHSRVEMMHTVVITTAIGFTQIKMFRHLLERMLRIAFLISIGHFSPELCFFGEINAVLGVDFDGSHWWFSGERCKHKVSEAVLSTPQTIRRSYEARTKLATRFSGVTFCNLS